VHSARAAARDAANLDQLGATLARFDGCSLKATAKNLCFYRGAAKSRIMLVGEAPGRDEDIEGKPFVGRAGQLLDKMLGAIQLTEQDVHITNIVYWRPPAIARRPRRRRRCADPSWSGRWSWWGRR
jgi:DNA polymerase